MYIVAFSKLLCGHFGIIILLLLQGTVSIVTGGLLLYLPVTEWCQQSLGWLLAATDHAIGGNSHCMVDS